MRNEYTQIYEWGKFNPKKIIQIGGVKLTTLISQVKKFNPEELSKKISKDLGDLFNLTLYTKRHYPNYMT